MPNPRGFDAKLYSAIGYDELVIFAAASLSEGGREITFENLVATCFDFFPERFALRGYPQWLDSAVVNKSWLRCRTDKGYLTGSVKDGFRLTAKGLQAASKAEKSLATSANVRSTIRPRLAEERTREGRFLRSLERSRSFKVYVEQGNVEALTDFDVCDVLLCTLDSSPITRRSNLALFKHAAELYRRTDLSGFLSSIEQRFAHLFSNPVLGGMMRKKSKQR